MKTISLEWNELLIVLKHNNDVTCWTANRRMIESFAGPEVWVKPEIWPTLFAKQPDDSGWGFEGYGLIVIDMDAKTAYSLNDYMSVGAFQLPSDSNIESEPEKTKAGLFKLLGTPSAWPYATIQVAKNTLLGLRVGQPVDMTLDLVLPADASSDEAKSILQSRRGLIQFNGSSWLFLNGNYLPKGWTVLHDRGQEEPEFTIEVLHKLQKAGFPAPDWDNINARIEQNIDDVPNQELVYAEIKELVEKWI